MRWRLRNGIGLAAAAALALTPVLTAAQAPVMDANPQRAAGSVDRQPAVPVGDRTATGSEQEGLTAHLPVPQLIEPQTTLVARSDRDRKVRLSGPRGSRVWTASALASHDLPQAAMDAYKNAAAIVNGVDPSCELPWTLLAGIGRVESDHGRYGGSVLSTDGVSRPAIIGVALNGKGPVAAISDSDDGALDGDKVWDRAVGPMQFIPTTWAYAGRDGDGDGRKNPHDLDDAALAAAGYLCSGFGSMRDDAAAKAAIFRYNPSDYYVALVQAFEEGYRTGVFVLPSPPPPPEEKKDRPRKDKTRDKTREVRQVRDKASPTRSPKPSASADEPSKSPRPSPKPSPKPSPTQSPSNQPSPTPTKDPSPSAPVLEPMSGSLEACGSGWCLGGRTLDLGPDSQLAARAAHDYDGDGVLGTNRDELTALVGQQVQVSVGSGTGVVYVLQDEDYRNADGSFPR